MAQTSPPGRAVGRSTTKPSTKGHEVGLSDPLDTNYICQKICDCHKQTDLIDKLGRKLKQRCVTARIQKDEEYIGRFAWRYKAEVGYYMSNPPKPLMSKDQPTRPSRFPLGRAMGDGLLLRNLEGRTQKGMLRIPDITILKITGPEIEVMRAAGKIDWDRFIPVQRNIESIVEIKFPGDELSPGQKADYPKIAGDGEFIIMTIEDCDCGRKRRQPATEPVRVPVTTPMKQDNAERVRWYQAPQPQLVPVPAPRAPQYGPVAQPGTGGIPLSDWLESTGKKLAKTAEYVAVGALAVGTAVAVVALLPAEAAVAAVVLVVVGAGAVVNTGQKKDDHQA